jgi:hypothetical protein
MMVELNGCGGTNSREFAEYVKAVAGTSSLVGARFPNG